MLKRKNRKGFTLAELLIVVAIIAVLVAIAVPLFVGGLTKAQNATFDANVHAVKSAALVAILNDDELDLDTDIPANGLYAEATVEDGEITGLTLSENDDSGASATADYAAWKAGSNKIKVVITKTDIANATSGLHS